MRLLKTLTTFLLLLSIYCVKADTIYFDNNSGYVSILFTFIDSGNEISVDELIRSEIKMQPSTKIPNFGVTSSVVWVKATVKNLTNHNLFFEINNPLYDEISFYKVVNSKVVDSVITGLSYPFNSRKNDSRSFVYQLSLDKGESATYYFRSKTNKLNIFPLFLSDEKELIKRESNVNIYNAVYLGIILVMSLYNLFICYTVRDKDYLFYVLYILAVGATQFDLNGYAHKFLWSNQTWITLRTTTIFGALSGIATIYFVRNFLQTKKYSKLFHRLLTVFMVIYVVSLVLTIKGDILLSYNLINLNAGPGSFLLLATAIYIYVKYKFKSALYFIVAWSLFLVSVIGFVLKDYGLIQYSDLTVYGLQIGSTFVVVLLSFALADKINTYRKEKEIAQSIALDAARDNERIIKEQNVILEGRVEERTRALRQSNDELERTLTNLKQTQSQLVEQEKMASLGQLTAGIAHEINNPINFVSSNVKPLKRDMDLMIDLLDRIEQAAVSQTSIEEKRDFITKLKAEYDFEYLKEEVGYLLKGIEEGAVRTADIVKGLRIFSRVDEDDLKLADIHEGIDSTLIITTNLMNGKVKLNKNYCAANKVECYPGKLNQVFLNIISNAVYAIKEKFHEKVGGEITITTQSDGTFFEISISDNGIGMSEEIKNKIFEPFFTTKPVGDGTGLGMSIAFTTIQRHCGSLDVKTALGEGTTFIIKIPVKQS